MKKNNYSRPCESSGFTIVELLVSIVIIVILVAISIVAYIGVSNRANIASLQSDLAHAKIQMKMFQTENSAFPSANNCPTPGTGEICLKLSRGNTLVSYSANNLSIPQTFLLILSKDTVSYKITDSTKPTQLAQTMQPGVTPGAIVELHGAKANSGTSPGINSPITTTWADTSGNDKNGVLSNLAGTPWQGVGTAINPYRMVFDGIDDSLYIPTLDLKGGGYTFEIWGTRNNAGTAWNVLMSQNQGMTIYWLDNGDLITGLYTMAGTQWAGIISQRHVFDLGALTHYVITVNNNNLITSDYVNKVSSGPLVMGEPMKIADGVTLNFSQQPCPIGLTSLRIYPFPLTQSQIDANFDAGADW